MYAGMLDLEREVRDIGIRPMATHVDSNSLSERGESEIILEEVEGRWVVCVVVMMMMMIWS